MKYLVFIAVFVLFSCEKDAGIRDLPENTNAIKAGQLIGKWILEATKISPGGPVGWTEATSGERLTFDLDQTFIRDFNNGSDVITGTFEILDNKLHLYYRSNNQEEVERIYYLRLEDSVFQINYIGCIEACSERYRRKN